MNRNWDTIREILLKIEASEPNIEVGLSDFDDSRSNEITYHIRLMEEANLIKATIHEVSDGPIIDIERLTWSGHELLDAIRNATIWEKTKAKIADKGGAMACELVKSVAIQIATGLIL
jgi:hypothetical protein